MKVALASALGALLLALSACGVPDAVERVTDYRAQVEAALGTRPLDDPAAALPRLPRRRERRLDIADHRIGMVDFLAIQGCGLGALAGHRNSPLGQVMPPTRRLVYELEVLEAGAACLDELGEERRARLEHLLAAKRAELPRHLWNALWMSEALERYLATAAVPSVQQPDGDALAGLSRLRRQIASERLTREVGIQLEAALGQLRDEPPLGQALRQLDHVGTQLDAVASLVEAHPPGPCREQHVRLAHIFRDAYLPVQAELARLDQSVGEALVELDGAYRASAVRVGAPPEAMLHYHAQVLDPAAESGLWQRYRRAMLRHAAAWGPTLRACGVLPEEMS